MNAGIQWRLLDTGLLDAAHNLALDEAMLQLRRQAMIPDTIRFLQFSRPSVLIGRHQIAAQEARLDFCRENDIDINRRITGGGAIYMDTAQLGWEVIATRGDLARRLRTGTRLEDLTELVCRAVVSGLRLLGIIAAFRPRNDIEVDGRKISGTGGAYDGDAFLFQGTLLIKSNVESIFRALRVPTEKLAAHEIASASERIVDLASLLPDPPDMTMVKSALARGFAQVLDIELIAGGLTKAEARMTAALLPRFGADAWVNDIDPPAGGSYSLSSIHKGAGGLVRADASVDLDRHIIRNVMFTGDFFMSPARAVYDLESRLKNTRFDDAAGCIEEFFLGAELQTLSLQPADFIAALQGCLGKCTHTSFGFTLEQAQMISLVGGQSLEETAALASVLLLPYCAKAPDCHLRQDEGCDQCSECHVGEAYALAGRFGIRPITIQDYGHFKETLSSLRASGVKAFIGCCCSAFLAKRYQTFTASGLFAAIIDIGSSSCYDLKQEGAALRGNFENQTHLRLDILSMILKIGADNTSPSLKGSLV